METRTSEPTERLNPLRNPPDFSLVLVWPAPSFDGARSPAPPSGPSSSHYSSSNHELGSDLWAAGPALALFVQPDPWTVGALLENAWSFAGSGHEKINEFSAQYFLNYDLPHGWFLESNATVTADWEAGPSDRWTVPLGGGFGKVFTLGSHSLSVSAQAFYNEPRPSTGPNWSVVVGLQLLFPG